MCWQLKTISVLPEDFVNHINDGVFVTSYEGQYLYANESLARIYGFSDSKQLMKFFKDIGNQLYLQGDRRLIFKGILEKNGRVDNFESQVKRKDGTIIWIRETAWISEKKGSRIISYAGTVTDITAEHRYYHDEATGLPKRFLLEKKLQEILDQKKSDLGLILFEVQDFIDSKNIQGESTVQQMIFEMVKFLKDHISESMTLARIEQHQFVFLYPGAGHLELISFVNQMQKLKNMHFDFEGSQFHFNEFCMGLLLKSAGEELNASQALSQVQLACRHAKDKALTHAIFETVIESQYRQRTEQATELRHAGERKELYLVYHPQINLKTGKVEGAEILMRWRRANGELVGPDIFIPMAESAGLIHQMGLWAMEEGFGVLKKWQEKGLDWNMSVNVSVAQLIQDDFVDKVISLLKKTKVNPKKIILEVTESSEIPESKIKTINKVKNIFRGLGIIFSLDDFGAGHSLGHLIKLGFDELKMDKSFWESPNASELLKMVANLTQGLGIRLVVEGVETREQLELLNGLGIEVVVQGFLFSKPLSLDDLENTYAKI